MTHSVEPIPAKPYGSAGGVVFLPSVVRVKDGVIYTGHQIVEADSAVTHARALLSAVEYVRACGNPERDAADE
jgi:hypothetical protein